MAAISTAILTAASLAATGIGTYMSMSGAQQQAEIAQKLEAQRRRAMELDARRRQLEMMRQMQRARALALVTHTAQGAQFGSTLEGAYGQISGQTMFNQQGVLQNLEIGRNMFGLNAEMAAAQGMSSMGSGFTSLGGSLMNAIGPVGRLAQGINFSPLGPTGTGGYTYPASGRGLA